MAIKNIEIQDHEGNVYHPHTDANVVFTSDGKTVEEKLESLKQSASNGKNIVATAIGTPLSSNDIFSVMGSKIDKLTQTFRNNLNTKGVNTTNADKMSTLIGKVGEISTIDSSIAKHHGYLRETLSFKPTSTDTSGGLSYLLIPMTGKILCRYQETSSITRMTGFLNLANDTITQVIKDTSNKYYGFLEWKSPDSVIQSVLESIGDEWWEINTSNAVMTAMSRTTIPTGGTAWITHGGLLYKFTSHSSENTVIAQQYNESARSWTTKGTLTIDGSRCEVLYCCAEGDNILIIGFSSLNNTTMYIWRFNPINNTFTLLNKQQDIGIGKLYRMYSVAGNANNCCLLRSNRIWIFSKSRILTINTSNWKYANEVLYPDDTSYQCSKRENLIYTQMATHSAPLECIRMY